MKCNVCNDTGTVRLPTFAMTTLTMDDAAPPDDSVLYPGFKTFPCPNCGPLRVKAERIGAIKAISTVREDMREAKGYVDSVKSMMSAQLGAQMLKNGWIDFKEQVDKYNGSVFLRAEAYVAHPDIGRTAKSSTPQPNSMGEIVITFDPDIENGREAIVSIYGRKFRARLVDYSVRMNAPEKYIDMRRMEYVLRSSDEPGFDMTVDLKSAGVEIKPPAIADELLLPGPPPKSEPIVLPDPFAREIDIE